ncbi:MAG: polysaccharide biosynthesis protein [Patescibacteria group bacterium]
MLGKSLKSKRVLVTGGTGSFGSLFVKSVLQKYSPKEIIVFSRDEDKQGAMRLTYKNEPRIRFMLGDVRDFDSINEASRGVDFIIHAAALKWIPEVEYNVWEGIRTNVIGARNIIMAAREQNVEKVVALSTDKALEPINAYGMAKALQERLMTTANLYDNGTQTIFVNTRYGNVLGSRGSVVPLFKSLIGQGKPLTVTDPKMTRFLLTLEQSVELVLTALEEGVGGEVFTRKMPAHTIGDLVEIMSEAVPKSKRKVEVIGKRPGEKMHESLVSEVESARTVEIGDYYVILPQIKIEAIEKKYKSAKRMKVFHFASNTTRCMSKQELREILRAENWI